VATPEKLILRDVSVTVNSVVLTGSARAVTVDTSADEVEVTTFGGAGWREFEPGLHAGSIEVEFYQGFDAGGVHETLWPLSQSNASFPLAIGPKGAVAAATNPIFTATVKLFQYRFLQGEVGAASTNPVTFRLIGSPTVAITMAELDAALGTEPVGSKAK
jgi:hypothetical protein